MSATTVPYKQKPLVTGARIPLFRRMPASAPCQSVAFTGRGIVPDFMSDTAHPVMMPHTSMTMLEEGAAGNEGMMPPVGLLAPLQSGQKVDNGAGGAGSFATRGAFGAKG